jgi:hypothetical protein
VRRIADEHTLGYPCRVSLTDSRQSTAARQALRSTGVPKYG